VKAETLAEHKMHEERFELGEETVRAVNEAKKNGNRVIAVGTTSGARAGKRRTTKQWKTQCSQGKNDTSLFIRRFNFGSWMHC
jgi:S-adenosylmethionine:tRNA ribosyltransferase-isomerase